MTLTPTELFERRCAKFAEDVLEGPLHRRNWSVRTRDAIAESVAEFVKEELKVLRVRRKYD